jgi:pyruvate,water dikinase
MAGGKGANLGELVRAGFPVPAGFVVTTAAYDRFVASNGLDKTIAHALDEKQGSGATIRDAFESAPSPPEIERAILAAYRQLGEGPVAVRSSATAEDLPEAAFAGQQDTFLNVVGTQALLGAVRRCWASLWTDRAIAYRARQGLGQQKVKLAVVVQRMVSAEAAGVLFTANPITGARDEIVVDASLGLGEAVVSGLVTPDHFVLRKRPWGWSIAERRLGRREVIVRPRAEGGTEHVSQETVAAPQAALSDQALRRLAGLGATIQHHFGAPQDVEWAWSSGKHFIVQARPITALPEPPPRVGRLQRVSGALMAELLPIRPYPVDLTTWTAALVGIIVPMLRVLGLAVRPFEQTFVQEDGVVVRLSGMPLFRPTLRMLLAPMRVLRVARHYDPVRWKADPLLGEGQVRLRDLEARDLRALSWQEQLAMVREAPAVTLPAIGELRRRYIPPAMLAAGRLRLALAMLGQGNRFGALLSGVESKTLEANRALEELAARVRSDPALAAIFSRQEGGALWSALEEEPAGRAFLADLRVFLDRYGHRETASALLVSQPTWKDAPEVVLGMVKSFAAAEPRPPRDRPAWEVARDGVLAHPLLRIRPLRSAFLHLLGEARYLWQIREDTHFYATTAMPVVRRALLELGRRLTSAGVLDAPEDVFHLRLDELERLDGTWPPPPRLADGLRELALRRKARRAALEGTPLVDPRYFARAGLRGDVRLQGNVLLRGTPGSPGVAEGPVRIIRNASDFAKLRAGEVLVAPYTNPAWTPLFQRAAAVVVDTGGPGSHAAIVAREYGIPAVMATVEGTRRLADGERVRVDGSRGLVFGASPPTTGHDVRGTAL